MEDFFSISILARLKDLILLLFSRKFWFSFSLAEESNGIYIYETLPLNHEGRLFHL